MSTENIQKAAEEAADRIEWRPRYSTTDKPDETGRWAREGYYRGLRIFWVSRTVIRDGQARFVVMGHFPTNANDNPTYYNVTTSLDECLSNAEHSFFKFRDAISAKQSEPAAPAPRVSSDEEVMAVFQEFSEPDYYGEPCVEVQRFIAAYRKLENLNR